jgi:serine/threonine protein kinase
MAFFCIHCKSPIDSQYKACPYCGDAITDFLRRYLEHPLDGKYQILSRLGVGGMGEVYKVLHTHLNQIRVIKLMRSNISADPGAHERFLREARLATKIQHPNVAALFDFSTLEDGSNYMVWEYIEGINLHELIDQRGPLSPKYAAKLAIQALHGLEAIHRAGIVHRDISPENLMITKDVDDRTGSGGIEERVKIIDLGIAKSSSTTTEDNKTKTGIFVGKWKYCSPEHLGMLPVGERIDGRADLYSFGIVLYEMLTGVPAFVADTPHAYLMKHASERPKALRDVNPSVVSAPELEALIFRALEKDRNKRFNSAREFARALEAVAANLPDDLPGAPPPLPSTAELTDEATRQKPIPAPHAPTLVSVQMPQPQAAVQTERTPAPMQRDLRDAPPAEFVFTEESRGGKWGLSWIAAIVFLVALAGGAAWWKARQGVVVTDTSGTSGTSTTSSIATQQGHLGINAYPWANVTSVRNLDSGQTVDIGADVVTPAPLGLAPGRYEVTLSNPAFPNPITRTVDIAAGDDETLYVTFSDPASASVPDFGARQ